MARWWKQAGIAVRESGDETGAERPDSTAAGTAPSVEPTAAEAACPAGRMRGLGLGLVATAVGLVAGGAAVAAMLRRRRRPRPGAAVVRFGRRVGDAVRERIAGQG